MDSYRHVFLLVVRRSFAEHLESGGSVQKIGLQCHLVLRVPEIPFQNEGVLPVVAQGP
jgi:hypothetical protein